MKKKAVFLDRDGTIIVDKHYLNNPADVEFLPEALEGLVELKKNHFLLVVVTNQSGVARGLIQEENIDKIHQRMQELLVPQKIQMDRFYYSPHAPDSNHPLRKPNPGMLLQAAKDLDIDLSQSFMIGDKSIDVEAGHRAGVRSILISDAHDEETMNADPDFFAANLKQAAAWILAQNKAP
jgi:D-glycero-D-manno-heptose 1,7-bisphosphate phosphatase